MSYRWHPTLYACPSTKRWTEQQKTCFQQGKTAVTCLILVQRRWISVSPRKRIERLAWGWNSLNGG